MFGFHKKLKLPDRDQAPVGRLHPLATSEHHFVNGRALAGPYPEHCATVILGLGCFWGAERKFWQAGEGVWVTAVGYIAGFTPNPTYEEVCSGMTGHNEVVLIVYDPIKLSFANLLKIFWENHDPTQGMKQGNDVGTQYRSGIYVNTPDQRAIAEEMRESYNEILLKRGFKNITTEITENSKFYFAEGYHQQYLAKNPAGYCGLGGTGVSCE
jgi:peptide-methionine (S)-S-oxide reductase